MASRGHRHFAGGCATLAALGYLYRGSARSGSKIDFDSTSKWAEEQGLTYTNYRNLVALPAVRELVQREVDAVNARMAQVQQVRKFHLLTKELDHDDGEVTATMKVRRKSIGEKYAEVIEQLYA